MIIGLAHDLEDLGADKRDIGFFVDSLKRRGIGHRLIDVNDFDESELQGLDAVISRGIDSVDSGVLLPANCQKLSIPCFNSVDGHRSTDKWAMYNGLLARGIQTPRTIELRDVMKTMLAGDHVVLKPCHDEGGCNVYRLRNDPKAILQKAGEIRGFRGEPLVQEYINSQKVHKLCFIGDRIASYFVRESAWDQDGRVRQGAYLFPKLDSRLERFAAEARKSCLCELLGIDVLEDDDGSYHVIDFNVIFGFRGFRAANPQLVEEIVDYVLGRLQTCTSFK